jgi:hypothetical protein|tara:strand:- start:495 stop:941 length:447 start_codon:yes stop_codon:yes gene_type:complete
MAELTYDKETGIFTRHCKSKDVVAGYMNVRGYVVIYYGGRPMYAHRMVFLFMGKSIPEFVDHKNGVRSDNRWDNLRVATSYQNQHNSKISKNNSSGIKGVSKNKNGYYVAKVKVKNKAHSRTFNDISLAEEWTKAKRKELHGKFCNDG